MGFARVSPIRYRNGAIVFGLPHSSRGDRPVKRLVLVVLAITLLAPASALAQKKRTSTRTTTAQKNAAAAAAAKAAQEEVATARQRVAAQIKTLSQFLYLLGGINKTIENADRAAAKGRVPDSATASTQRSKDTVVDSIKNVRLGLQKLESDFQTSPNLLKYSLLIEGISVVAQGAEGQAASGKFDDAGRTLLTVVNKLADAMTSMP
jgi:type II secretory pathway pseudopilin PulG